ncbi:MAG: hypothetical protein RIC14_07490 [Filomicrobium sp.]
MATIASQERNKKRERCAATGLLLSAAIFVLWATPAANAQEGWPYSEWEEQDRTNRAPNRPENRNPTTGNGYSDSSERLRQMREIPQFGDADPNNQAGAQGGGNPSFGRSPNNGTFAAPTAVERTNLAPLDPIPQAAPPTSDRNYSNTFDPRNRTNSRDAQTGRRAPSRINENVAPTSPRNTSRDSNGWRATPRVANENTWQPAPAQRFSETELGATIDPAKALPLVESVKASPKSATLHMLLAQALAARPTLNQPADPAVDRYEAARIDALTRLGFLRQASRFKIPTNINRQTSDWAGFALRRSIVRTALDRPEDACRDARDIVSVADGLPRKDKDEAILLSGYCAAHQKNRPAVQLAADVARDREGFSRAGIAALEAAARGSTPRVSSNLQLSPISYRMLLNAGADAGRFSVGRASDLLLVTMAQDSNLPPESQTTAAELAAAKRLIPTDTLIAAYKRTPAASTDLESLQSGASGGDPSPALARARLYRAAVRQQTPLRKVRLIREFLDKSAKAGLFLPALELMAAPVASMKPVPEIGWFSETAIEALLAVGDTGRARDWVRLAEISDPRGPRALAHWTALIDIADASRSARRGEGLASVEQMALQGRFRPVDLHRLATVLDALDYQVPIPLWEAASRTPQPSDGHLPATGILPQLQDTAKSGDAVLAGLLIVNTIGPKGPRGAHIIALGDTIRALKRLGMEKEARRIGFEALFESWPRAARG